MSQGLGPGRGLLRASPARGLPGAAGRPRPPPTPRHGNQGPWAEWGCPERTEREEGLGAAHSLWSIPEGLPALESHLRKACVSGRGGAGERLGAVRGVSVGMCTWAFPRKLGLSALSEDRPVQSSGASWGSAAGSHMPRRPLPRPLLFVSEAGSLLPCSSPSGPSPGSGGAQPSPPGAWCPLPMGGWPPGDLARILQDQLEARDGL